MKIHFERLFIGFFALLTLGGVLALVIVPMAVIAFAPDPYGLIMLILVIVVAVIGVVAYTIGKDINKEDEAQRLIRKKDDALTPKEKKKLAETFKGTNP